MTKDEAYRELLAISKTNLKTYTKRTTPTVEPCKIIGVSVPDIRKLAKKITDGDWHELLNYPCGDFFEERMLFGIVIATAKMDINTKLEYVKSFVPLIDNWAVCDIFCNSFKPKKSEKDIVWSFIQPYFYSQKAFDVRFAVVMLLSHFIDEEHYLCDIALLDKVRHDDYYVKMAVAWAISVLLVKFKNKTTEYLKNASLDDFTYNKALQKAIESYRIDDATKNILREMKRK